MLTVSIADYYFLNHYVMQKQRVVGYMEELLNCPGIHYQKLKLVHFRALEVPPAFHYKTIDCQHSVLVPHIISDQ